MGNEPAQVTRIERDRRGRVISIITTREPEFSERDRHMILAQRRDDAAPRNAHGVPIAEATDPANRDAYEVPLPVMDFAEATLARAQKKYSTDYPDAVMDSLLWQVRLKPDHTAPA